MRPPAHLADVVLPSGVATPLAEIVSAARHRATVLDRRSVAAHVSYGRGVAALFHGPPAPARR